jgi:hypothetical protein
MTKYLKRCVEEMMPLNKSTLQSLQSTELSAYTFKMYRIYPMYKFFSPPTFLNKSDSHNDTIYYARKGQNLTVKTHLIAYGKFYFQLLIDVEKFNNVTNTTDMEFAVLNTSRNFVKVKTEGGVSEWRVDFYFTNISSKDFLNYTIKAGNANGYYVFKFAIKEEQGWSSNLF